MPRCVSVQLPVLLGVSALAKICSIENPFLALEAGVKVPTTCLWGFDRAIGSFSWRLLPSVVFLVINKIADSDRSYCPAYSASRMTANPLGGKRAFLAGRVAVYR